ncbi:ArsC family transcriptional regulator [Amylibacter kogurei]|uniref:ArsC family transcriptional regulator n=1 Tax=Paramylibacter kogurei TaxID=1889778 RepID=A0A2G5K5Y8_9RHOB|nr:low molecular weight phosphatase family protein [Amylibacter kogurei]PIB24124.1 ArsC family transcriptional regulator [Amylibacter kogurei]
MTQSKPSAVLFCCDHNSIRSPMGEGMLKQHVGTSIFVQSAGVKNDKDIDGFAIAVCQEIGVELTKHKVRSFEDLEDWGDDLDSYDLIIACSQNSADAARMHTKGSAVEVEFWDIDDPTIKGETREEKLNEYRAVRDDIQARIKARFT